MLFQTVLLKQHFRKSFCWGRTGRVLHVWTFIRSMESVNLVTKLPWVHSPNNTSKKFEIAINSAFPLIDGSVRPLIGYWYFCIFTNFVVQNYDLTLTARALLSISLNMVCCFSFIRKRLMLPNIFQKARQCRWRSLTSLAEDISKRISCSWLQS